jgi:hypothetical protein
MCRWKWRWLLTLVAAVACKASESSTAPSASLTQRNADATVAQLARLLPDTLGSFRAQSPATTRVYLPEAMLRAERRYASGARSLTVEIETGNIRAKQLILEQQDEHAFLSDSPTYWRTVDVKGHRARVAEDRAAAVSSEAYVSVGPHVVARLVVDPPAGAGESVKLAEALDFDALAAAGVAGPVAHEQR